MTARIGRPHVHPEEGPRDVKLSIRLSAAERRRFDRVVEQIESSASDALRAMLDVYEAQQHKGKKR